MKTLKILLFLPLLVILSGCCAVFMGTSQEIKVNTKPEDGVFVYTTNNALLGKTPLTVKLPKENKVLIARKNGYGDLTFQLNRRVAFWPFLVDFILWPTAFVDIFSNAFYKYDDEYSIEMYKICDAPDKSRNMVPHSAK